MLLDVETLKINPADVPKSFKTLQQYLSTLVDGINDCLSSIDEGNFVDGFIDTLKATTVIANTIISNVTITENLYAVYGDVAELTVDRLLTANKVKRYTTTNTADINYIWIEGQSIKLMTGTTDGSTTQHVDRYNQPLYYYDATQTGMSTSPTAFPVIVYAYTELVKAEMSFEDVDGTYVPRIILGAGTGDGNVGKAYIWKGVNGMLIKYNYSATRVPTISLTDFVDADMRRISDVFIDKIAGQISVTMEGVSTPFLLGYTETASSMTFTWPDGHTATVGISV